MKRWSAGERARHPQSRRVRARWHARCGHSAGVVASASVVVVRVVWGVGVAMIYRCIM